MRAPGNNFPRSGQVPGTATRPRRSWQQATWRFVYIFFTNGIPFDAPNRSEPCPRC